MKSITPKIIATLIVSVLGLSLFSFTPVVHAADDICSKNPNEVPEAVYKAAGCDGNQNELPNTITSIINSIIAVTGLIAVIFVLIGGINYITSAGDSGKLEKAKKTILYACIGLAICALAFAIVNWVIVGVLQQGSQDDNNQTNSQNAANNKTSPKATTK